MPESKTSKQNDIEQANISPIIPDRFTYDVAQVEDFLDMVFRLEKEFSIEIPKGELFADEVWNNPDYVENDMVTPAGLEKFKEAMPHADFSSFEQEPHVSKIPICSP